MKRTLQRQSFRRGLGVLIASISAVALVVSFWASGAFAAPGSRPAATTARGQNVDYLSAANAQSLGVGIDVLVPSSVPTPFGGVPQIEASSGYYSLYWMIPGSPPTFLQVSGTAGGSLPAGSPADLNNELSINASVRGADAIHDVTSIYDNVWWIEGGVLYEVSSLNMTGTDTMGLADSLISLDVSSGDTGGAQTPPAGGQSGSQTPPAGDQSGGNGSSGSGQANVSVAGSVPSGFQATVVVGGVDNATLTASDGTFVDTGSATYPGIGSQSIEWQAPSTAQDETVTFTLTDPNSGAALATGQIIVSGSGASPHPTQATGAGQSLSKNQTPNSAPTAPPAASATTPPATVPAATQNPQQQTTPAASTGQGGNASASTTTAPPPDTSNQAPATSASLRESGSRILSDGTEGPPPPVYAGDGTGGSYTVTLPVRHRADQ